MKINQNDHLLNSQIARFYDTPEQRQLLSSYNAPSIDSLIYYQIKIHHNYPNDTKLQTDDPEEWPILSHLTRCIDNDQNAFIYDTINVNDKKLIINSINDINARISTIKKNEGID